MKTETCRYGQYRQFYFAVTTSEKVQRRRESRKKSDARVIRLQIKDRLGNPRWVTADLLNTSEGGIGISILTPLAVASKIVVRGDLGENRKNVVSSATVKWCSDKINGTFRAGLELGDISSDAFNDSPTSKREDPEEPDWYEIMQLSPNADADTIGRVYRILAQRCHPDSSTGNQETFLRLCEAHRALSNPESRAQYDARYRETKRLHWKIFDRAEVARGPGEEQRKRQGILELLYAKTLHDPERATLSVHEFEELLGCPREHLEAALWYLRGKGYVSRGDNGRFTITVSGFDEAESNPQSRENRGVKLLEPGRV